MEQVFCTERISFVKITEQLLSDYLIMINDYENVNRFTSKSGAHMTEEDEIAWVKKKLDNKAPAFSMIEKKTGEFIGNIELVGAGDSVKELGIAITAGKQDMGYGTEAIPAIVKYGFKEYGLQKIVLKAKPENARAIHVYKKCGFREYDRNGENVFMEIS